MHYTNAHLPSQIYTHKHIRNICEARLSLYSARNLELATEDSDRLYYRF